MEHEREAVEHIARMIESEAGDIYWYSEAARPYDFEALARNIRLAAIAPYREALTNARAWIASLTVIDMNEIVADGGITAGMVVGQEAIEQVRRIDKTLTQLAKGSE